MEELSKFCWGFLYGNGSWADQIVSIQDEEDARYIAELFPDHIYFFADEVPHPNS